MLTRILFQLPCWLSLGGRDSLLPGCPGRVGPSGLHLGSSGSEATGRTLITSPLLTGELSSCCHLLVVPACHCRGNPAGGPSGSPSPAPQPPRSVRPALGAETLEPPGSRFSGSSQGSGERARPRPRTPPHSARTRAHNLRAPRHRRAHAQPGPGTLLLAAAPVVREAQLVPRRRRWPPAPLRPSNPPSPQLRAPRSSEARVRGGSAPAGLGSGRTAVTAGLELGRRTD